MCFLFIIPYYIGCILIGVYINICGIVISFISVLFLIGVYINKGVFNIGGYYYLRGICFTSGYMKIGDNRRKREKIEAFLLMLFFIYYHNFTSFI